LREPESAAAACAAVPLGHAPAPPTQRPSCVFCLVLPAHTSLFRNASCPHKFVLQCIVPMAACVEVKSVVEDTSLDEYEEEGAKAFEQFESKLGDDK